MTEEPATKAAILARFRAAVAAFDEALERLDDAQLSARPEGGAWSARDVLAHLAADHRWLVGQLKAATEGRVPTAMECYGTEERPDASIDISTQDGRNAAQFERNRLLSLDDIQQSLAHYRGQLFALIEGYPENEFERPYAIAENEHVGQVRPARDGEFAFPLWQWLRGTTWHHYEAHVEDMRAAANRRPS